MIRRRRIGWTVLVLAAMVAALSVLDSLHLSPIQDAEEFFTVEYRKLLNVADVLEEETESAFLEDEIYKVGFATLVNLSKSPPNASFACVSNAWIPSVKVCLHPESKDRLASRELARSGTWETRNTELFLAIMAQHRDLDLIDIGANLGQFSLLAAGLGRRVVAVEPYTPSLRRLQKSVQINNFTSSQIALVADAISDERGEIALRTWRHSRSGVMVAKGNLSSCDEPCLFHTRSIVVDDLVPVIKKQFPNMSKALLKLDIEGHEHMALNVSNNMFGRISVPFVLMEWLGIKEVLVGNLGTREDREQVRFLVKSLKTKGYDHYMPNKLALFNRQFKLSDSAWELWPNEVLWIHEKYQPTM
jgi:FkbM family methyltransferase